MDIPPVIRASLVACENVVGRCRLIVPRKSRDSTTLRPPETAPPVINALEARQNSKNAVVALLGANVNETVKIIVACTGAENPSLLECINKNIKRLDRPQTADKRLSRYNVDIIIARTESLMDLLSLEQKSQLAWALANSDHRFRDITQKLMLDYRNTLPQISSQNAEAVLWTNTLVASSMLQMQQQRDSILISSQKLLKGSTEQENQLEQLNSARNNREVVDGVLRNCNECLDHLDSNATNQGLLLSLLQVLAIKQTNAKAVIPKVLQLIKIDEKCNGQELVDFVHALGLCRYNFNIDCELKCEDAFGRLLNFEILPCNVPRVFHAFHLLGNFTHPFFNKLVKQITQNDAESMDAIDFYRIAFPLAVSGVISEFVDNGWASFKFSHAVGKWLLFEFAKGADKYIKMAGQYLFVLTRLASCLVLTRRKRRTPTLELDTLEFEDDIYEKAEMYLRSADGSDACTYFPSDRAAMLHVFEKSLERCDEYTSDEFIQLLQAHVTRVIVHSTKTRHALLKASRDRVNSISCGGISQVLQSLLWLFSANNPDVVNVASMYMQRILAELTLYNSRQQLDADDTLYTKSFLNDVQQLSMVLWALDRCNLNSGELAQQVGDLLVENYDMLKNADIAHTVDIMHYMAFSLKEHESLDVLALTVHAQLRQLLEHKNVHAKDLVAILESCIACPTTLNAMRHSQLFQGVKKAAEIASGDAKSLKALEKTSKMVFK